MSGYQPPPSSPNWSNAKNRYPSIGSVAVPIVICRHRTQISCWLAAHLCFQDKSQFVKPGRRTYAHKVRYTLGLLGLPPFTRSQSKRFLGSGQTWLSLHKDSRDPTPGALRLVSAAASTNVDLKVRVDGISVQLNISLRGRVRIAARAFPRYTQ